MKGRPKDPKVQEILKVCKELGICYNTYRSRLAHGWSEEEARSIGNVGAAYRLPDGTPIYTHLKQIGKSYSTFMNYITMGCTVEEALDAVYKSTKGIKYFRDGISLREYCRQHGLNYNKELYKEKINDIKR